jgi:hypothetical protein
MEATNQQIAECADDLTLEEAKKHLDDLLLRVKLPDLTDFGNYLVTKAVEARQVAKGAPGRYRLVTFLVLPAPQPAAQATRHQPATSIAERKKLRQIDNIRADLRSLVPPDALAENEQSVLPHSATV